MPQVRSVAHHAERPLTPEPPLAPPLARGVSGHEAHRGAPDHLRPPAQRRGAASGRRGTTTSAPLVSAATSAINRRLREPLPGLEHRWPSVLRGGEGGGGPVPGPPPGAPEQWPAGSRAALWPAAPAGGRQAALGGRVGRRPCRRQDGAGGAAADGHPRHPDRAVVPQREARPGRRRRGQARLAAALARSAGHAGEADGHGRTRRPPQRGQQDAAVGLTSADATVAERRGVGRSRCKRS